MKLTMDEKLKHRLIGLAVIISIGVIFAPAMMRKSNQRLEGAVSNIKLPPNPLQPEITALNKKELFKTVKAVKVEIPSVAPKQTVAIIQADHIKHPNNPVKLAVAAPKSPSKPRAAVPKTVVKAPALKNVSQKSSVQKQQLSKKPTATVYSVQLASFNQISKAQSLVTQLRSKGFKGNIIKISSREGAIYKVHVGHSKSKQEVDKLKLQLASTVRMNGFVVNTRVS